MEKYIEKSFKIKWNCFLLFRHESDDSSGENIFWVILFQYQTMKMQAETITQIELVTYGKTAKHPFDISRPMWTKSFDIGAKIRK